MKLRKCAALSFICLLMVTTFAIFAATSGAQGPATSAEQDVSVTAKKFQFTPNEIMVRRGIPVVIRIVSQDVLHDFSCPGLKLRTDVTPGQENVVRFTPDKEGSFPFHCDIFCGSGHGGMTGTITVIP